MNGTAGSAGAASAAGHSAADHSPPPTWRRVLPVLFFVALSLAVSFGFFVEGLHSDYSALDGDQINILTICAKEDHPNALQGDLVVGSLQNVRYYTPVFVELIRVLSLPGHHYLRGLSLVLLLTSLVYFWGWWLLFRLWSGPWQAAIMAFIVRGILWPPGGELWGIAGLWTALPRTVFLALAPWILWLWARPPRSRAGWIGSCVLAGLAVNIHPVSGAGFAFALILAEIAWILMDADRKRIRQSLVSRLVPGILALVITMAPYVWTYVTQLGSTAGIDPEMYHRAMRMRLGGATMDPMQYIRVWLNPKWLLTLLGPLVIVALTRFLPQEDRGEASSRAETGTANITIPITVFMAGCMIASIAPFGVEALLAHLGRHERFAFQMVRVGKYALVGSAVLLALALARCARALQPRQYGRLLLTGVGVAVFLGTLFSRLPLFNGVPVIGDDLFRTLWPAYIRPNVTRTFEGAGDQGVLRWICGHTPPDARFVGPRLIRVACLRTVVFDWAGAGMLIEGNPHQFLKAVQREQQLEGPANRDPRRQAALAASWGADYWVTPGLAPGLHPAYYDGRWAVYDLHRLPAQGAGSASSSILHGGAAALPSESSYGSDRVPALQEPLH